MKLQKTTILERDDKIIVEIFIAESADTDQASESVSLRVEIPAGRTPPRFALIQRVALERARDVIDIQILEMRNVLNHVPG